MRLCMQYAFKMTTYIKLEYTFLLVVHFYYVRVCIVIHDGDEFVCITNEILCLFITAMLIGSIVSAHFAFTVLNATNDQQINCENVQRVLIVYTAAYTTHYFLYIIMIHDTKIILQLRAFS